MRSSYTWTSDILANHVVLDTLTTSGPIFVALLNNSAVTEDTNWHDRP